MPADSTDASRHRYTPDDPGGRGAREAAPRLDRVPRPPARRRLTLLAASLALVILAMIPATAVGAQSAYPPNTVVSTSFDARYCGDGAVSVVTDSGGNLIDVCASSSVRIYPVYADYASNAAYATPVYPNANFLGTAPLSANANDAGYYTGTVYGGSAYIYRQYTDTTSNCPNGAVTQTAAGYFCTATGTPAFRVA